MYDEDHSMKHGPTDIVARFKEAATTLHFLVAEEDFWEFWPKGWFKQNMYDSPHPLAMELRRMMASIMMYCMFGGVRSGYKRRDLPHVWRQMLCVYAVIDRHDAEQLAMKNLKRVERLSPGRYGDIADALLWLAEISRDVPITFRRVAMEGSEDRRLGYRLETSEEAVARHFQIIYRKNPRNPVIMQEGGFQQLWREIAKDLGHSTRLPSLA